VNVTDEHGQRCYFTLVKEDNHWDFGPELILPGWIAENEYGLRHAFCAVESLELVGQFYNN
jgi:hypothetical protein